MIYLPTDIPKLSKILGNLHTMIRHGDGFEICADLTDKTLKSIRMDCGGCSRQPYCEGDAEAGQLIKELEEGCDRSN